MYTNCNQNVCIFLFVWYNVGIGVNVMKISELQHKAKNGDGLSAYILGRSYYSSENGVTRNYQKSFEWYKFGYEELKDSRCLYGYAMFFYDDGESESENVVDKNNTYANEMFSKAYPQLQELYKKGEPYATFILGAYYNYGIGGVQKSFKEALNYIKAAAELDHSGALFDLGKFYEIGKGVEKNLNKAYEYYSKAAELGNVRAKERKNEIELILPIKK